jgi:hypothetical protein
MGGPMLKNFKMWFQEIEAQAMSTQKPWRVPEKNRDINEYVPRQV